MINNIVQDISLGSAICPVNEYAEVSRYENFVSLPLGNKIPTLGLRENKEDRLNIIASMRPIGSTNLS